MGYHRDLAWPLHALRNFFLGRNYYGQIRFADQLSPRPYPKPTMPGGPSHGVFENYYCTRDARRAVIPNKDLYTGTKQIASAPEQQKAQSAPPKLPPVPGKTYDYASSS